MLRTLIIGALSLLLVSLTNSIAISADRVALVIGNSKYTTVPKLPNPKNDARLISNALESVGFTVVRAIDANRRKMVRSIKKFVEGIGPETEAFVFYAGHGIQFQSENYLLPVDVEIETASDLTLEAIGLQAIYKQIESRSPRIAIVVLDACRNNPLKTSRSTANDGGLARTTGPLGTYLAFATAPGDVALDGKGNNSPFTRALADFIVKPGLPIEQVFKRVRERVVDETDGSQVPWDNSSLIGDFFFQKILLEVPKVAQSSERDARDWKSTASADTAMAYNSYLSDHPDGFFVDLAHTKLKSIELKKAKATEEKNNKTKIIKPKAGKRSLTMSLDVRDWNLANKSGKPEDFRDYLAAYPDGLFSKLARLKLEDTSSGSLKSVENITGKLTPRFEEFEENPLYPEVTQCDHLAGHVQEAADPAVGVFFRDIDVDKAIPACLKALEEYPDSLRLLINYARAIDASGRHDEAREIYRAGIDAGFPIAFRSLGDVYRDGRNVEINLKEARYWYVLGAEKNNVFAQLNLAVIYEKGHGVSVDKKKAVYWLWRAGRQGFATALEKLAGYYLRGEVVEKDPKQAAIMLQSAADMGNMWAEHNLAELYLNGTGIKKNSKLGKQFSQRAAIQGNKWAQAKLASLYKDGIGTKKNTKEALKWAYLANDAGVEWVKDMIKDLESKTSKKQRKLIRKQVASFVPRKVK